MFATCTAEGVRWLLCNETWFFWAQNAGCRDTTQHNTTENHFTIEKKKSNREQNVWGKVKEVAMKFLQLKKEKKGE